MSTTKNIQCAIGRKIYSLQCNLESVAKIQGLSTILNKMVNANTLKYPNLSDDNLFFITALELLDKLQQTASSPKPSGNITPQNTADDMSFFLNTLLISLQKINTLANDN